ncbi:MAG: ankyrin repeat domain-containing protein [Sulfurimonas sp.]|nr:ankyrin repeat domain-containing protein [Sulfurimonas sp.]
MLTLSQEEERRYEELQLMALEFAREGENTILQSMIEAGLSPNTTDNRGNSLLMLSAYNGNISTCKMLLEFGANPNSQNNHGHSILAGAAFKGYLDICKLIVEHGAVIDKNATKNPIVFAAIFGREEVVNYLQSVDNSTNKRNFLDNLMPKIASFLSLFRKKSTSA